MKFVVNRCYGGFGLSVKARKLLRKKGVDMDDYELDRTSNELIEVVEELGKEANGLCTKLAIIDVPENAINPYVEEYDGMETIREGRSW